MGTVHIDTRDFLSTSVRCFDFEGLVVRVGVFFRFWGGFSGAYGMGTGTAKGIYGDGLLLGEAVFYELIPWRNIVNLI
jgi:hypothetical protein